MKTLTYLLLLLPFFSYCEISDSTYIKSVESKIDTSISKNSAQLQLNLFQPNGSISKAALLSDLKQILRPLSGKIFIKRGLQIGLFC